LAAFETTSFSKNSWRRLCIQMQVKGTHARHGKQDLDNDVEMQSASEDLRSSDQSALLSESERGADPGAIRTSPASNNKMTGIRPTKKE
jgi:hypothetical protein